MTSSSFMESVRVNAKQNVINEKERIDIKMNFGRRISSCTQYPTLNSFGERSPTGQKLVPRNTQDYKMRQYWVAAAIKGRKMSVAGKSVKAEKYAKGQQQQQQQATAKDKSSEKKETENGKVVSKGSANGTKDKEIKNSNKDGNKKDNAEKKGESEKMNYKDHVNDIESLERLLDELELDCSTPKNRKKSSKRKSNKSPDEKITTICQNNDANKNINEFDFSGDPLEKLVDDLLGGMNLRNDDTIVNLKSNGKISEPIDLYASIGSTKERASDINLMEATISNKLPDKPNDSNSDKNSDSDDSSDSEVSDTEESDDSESSEESETDSPAVKQNKPQHRRIACPQV